MFGVDLFAVAARRGINNAFAAAQSFLGGLVVPKTAGTGIKVDTDSPGFGWADLLGEITPRTGAGTAPTFAAYRGSIYSYRLDTAGTNEVFNTYHPPHDMVPGEDWYAHSHWSVTAAPTGSCNWLFDAVYASGYNRGVFEGTAGSAAPVTLSVVDTPTTVYQHRIAETLLATAGGIYDPAPGVNVSITSGAAILTSSAPLFTAADIGRTVRVIGAGAAGGNLDTTVSAYTSTSQVTLAANAGTTVTAQPSYRYRVLDANLIEPDGIILVRTWTQPNRTADTLNVNAWMHYADLHYRTNGVTGTKTRFYPFYS